ARAASTRPSGRTRGPCATGRSPPSASTRTRPGSWRRCAETASIRQRRGGRLYAPGSRGNRERGSEFGPARKRLPRGGGRAGRLPLRPVHPAAVLERVERPDPELPPRREQLPHRVLGERLHVPEG